MHDTNDLIAYLEKASIGNSIDLSQIQAPMPFIYTVSDPRLEPHIGSEGAAGIDLRCNLGLRKDQPFTMLNPGKSIEFGTGVRVAIPKGWVGLVMPRSGLGFKYEVMLANSVGVIDSDYRGEVRVKLVNRGPELMTLEPFDRVVQMVIVPHWYMKHIQKVSQEEFEELTTERGDKGFGSSGLK